MGKLIRSAPSVSVKVRHSRKKLLPPNRKEVLITKTIAQRKPRSVENELHRHTDILVGFEQSETKLPVSVGIARGNTIIKHFPAAISNEFRSRLFGEFTLASHFYFCFA